jgi:hypothetical protein
MEAVRIRTFLAEFAAQEAEIEQIYKRLAAKVEGGGPPGATEEAVESIGYWLHNLYSAYEDLFQLVAGFWEDHVSEDGGYHVSLLRRMRVAIPEVRPALLIEDAALRHLDELRGFRHVFRHAYMYGLDGQRVLDLVRRALQHRDLLGDELRRFRKEIQGNLPPARGGLG